LNTAQPHSPLPGASPAFFWGSLDLKINPFALSVVSAANGVETLPSFDFGPIFIQDGAYAQDERKN
jgi:hypothetical protein